MSERASSAEMVAGIGTSRAVRRAGNSCIGKGVRRQQRLALLNDGARGRYEDLLEQGVGDWEAWQEAEEAREQAVQALVRGEL